MSEEKRECIILTCDECGSTGIDDYDVHWSNREEAEADGWRRVDEKDLCPRCEAVRVCATEGHLWGEWVRAYAGEGWVRFCERDECADGFEHRPDSPLTLVDGGVQ